MIHLVYCPVLAVYSLYVYTVQLALASIKSVWYFKSTGVSSSMGKGRKFFGLWNSLKTKNNKYDFFRFKMDAIILAAGYGTR